MPTLEPNQFPVDRFRCTRGVPYVFVRACILDVATERQQELWGLKFPNVDAEIRYLVDRELLNVRSCHPYGPELGGFVSPFDGSEIVSTVETDNTVPPGFQVRWRVYVNGKTFADGPLQSGTFVSLVPQSVLCLTPAGHDLREPLAQTVTAPPEGERSAMGDGQGGDGGPDRSKVRAAVAWLRDPIVSTVIGGLSLYALAVLRCCTQRELQRFP